MMTCLGTLGGRRVDQQRIGRLDLHNMYFIKASVAPLSLALVSVPAALLFSGGSPDAGLAFWAGVAAVAGLSLNSAVGAVLRYRRQGRLSLPVRAGVSIIASFSWCVLGVVICALSFSHLSYMATSVYYLPLKDPPGFPATLVLLLNGLLAVFTGAAGLVYLWRPSMVCYRAVLALGYSECAALLLWSLASYGPFAASDAQSHAVGAGLGTFLVVVVAPLIACLCIVVLLVLIKSLKSLVSP